VNPNARSIRSANEEKTMNRPQSLWIAGAACAFLAALVLQVPGGAEETRNGKAVFLENRCNSCHTVKAAGIEKKKASAEEAAAEKPKSDKKPPDLSGVGLERKADWIGKFLMKQETIKGDKHEKRFKGPEADLKLVSEWLAAQKAKPEKK
jgi:mono/diheme cytochrome c family protein